MKPNSFKKQSTTGGSTNYSTATGHYMHYTKTTDRTGNVSLRLPSGEFYILNDEHAATASEAKRLAIEFINRL